MDEWAQRRSRVSYPSCNTVKVLPLPLSLSCFCDLFSFLGPVSHTPFSFCIRVSHGLCGQRPLNLILLSSNISLEFYNLPGLSLIAWNLTLCLNFLGILFSFLKIPSSPSPEVRLYQRIKSRHSDTVCTHTEHSHLKGLGCFLWYFVRYAHFSCPDVPIIVIMNH